MSQLFFNEDCTNFFYVEYDPADGEGGAAVDAYVDQVAAGGVTAFLCNTNAERTNYASAVWEPFWLGFDPDRPDDQPYLAGIQSGKEVVPAAGWRRMVSGMLALHRQGVDYPARVIARCRHHGIAPWVSLRMNDVHVQENPNHPIHSDFWRHRPQLRRQGYEGYFGRALDYAHAAVRDHYLELVDETLARYDVDGLELDFLREPYLFSRGQEEAGRVILTTWLAEVRQRVRQAEARRGHPIRLGVRTPSRPEVALRFGLEPVEWARQGLVDLIVATPRWATLEYDLPLRQWRRLLAGCNVSLLGGLEVNIRPSPAAAQRGVTPEEALGAAAQVLHDGADGVYLFNYFPNGSATASASWWTREEYRRTLRAMTAPGVRLRQPRRHVVTFADVWSPDGGDGPTQLPAAGARIELSLPTGPKPPAGWQAELTLKVAAASAALPTVRVNDSAPLAAVIGCQPGAASEIRYAVPAACLREDAANRIVVTSADGAPLQILWAAIDIFNSCALEDPGAARQWLDTARAAAGQ